MIGQVYKIHSYFYYVKDKKHNILSCKVRDVLKKQKEEIVVGDFVELSDDLNFIVKRCERKNLLLKPKASNIDLAVVVASFKEPNLDYMQLNRYLIYLKSRNIDCVICINKEDLEKELKEKISEILRIYSSLGYKIFIISAKENIGISDISDYITNKTIVLCGASGVGKTTLVNALFPDYCAKTNEVSSKTMRGRHTTRHCEIVEGHNFKVIDTPGFSCLKFDFLLPGELIELFDDLKKYKSGCKYSNCLHNAEEKGICSIVDNLDKIDESRYKSYLEFLKESLSYKKEISKKSIKEESNKKEISDRIYTKISKKKRDFSRKKQKQNIEDI